MRLLDEKVERYHYNDDLRYANLDAYVKMQSDELRALEAKVELLFERVDKLDLVAILLERMEQIEVKEKIHPLKKMLAVKAK